MPALGEEFRSAREARGLTLSDVAEQIHIRSVYLNAIENEEWTAIGAPVYVRGFIRTYARFLALDSEEAVAAFNRIVPPERPSHTAVSGADERDRDGSGPRWSIGAIVGTVVALLLVGFVGYEYWQYAHGAGTASSRSVAVGTQPGTAPGGSQAQATATSPVPSARPSGTPAPAVHHQLAIRLSQRSWLRVVVDGKQQLEGIFPAGTARTFSGSNADVRAGNAAGVSVSVNGHSPAPMGKEGDVVEQRYSL